MDDAVLVNNSISSLVASTGGHRCLLLVDQNSPMLDLLANQMAVMHSWEQVSVGSELASALLDVPRARRSQASLDWVRRRLGQPTSSPRIASQIDLLFEPSLGLDPLALLRQTSRTAKIVAMWPGSFRHDVLAYGVPEHEHYQTWSRPEVAVTVLGAR